MKNPFVYIMASKRNGTLYIGVTSDLVARAWQHRTGARDGFAAKYDCKLLVWYEPTATMEQAIIREKQMKEWKRSWKLRLIEEANPDWKDLYAKIA
jgi:putative endonuclease